MKRNIWVRNTEIALLLPATFILAPLPAFAGLGMAFAVVQQKFLIAVAMLLIFLLSFLAGLLGLACVWVSLVVAPQKFVHRRRLRIGLACGILLGIADALYWLSTLRRELNSLGLSGWALWLLMLAGPTIIGAHQFVRLLRLQEAPVEAPTV
jgi:hypothetical protein